MLIASKFLQCTTHEIWIKSRHAMTIIPSPFRSSSHFFNSFSTSSFSTSSFSTSSFSSSSSSSSTPTDPFIQIGSVRFPLPSSLPHSPSSPPPPRNYIPPVFLHATTSPLPPLPPIPSTSPPSLSTSLACPPLRDSRPLRAHLQWMMQKDLLGQDMYLLADPSPFARRLCAAFAEATRRPWHYMLLTQDTTEADLKQRRELLSGAARFVDSPAVRAALSGAILVLDGVHRVERNVLPSLNNLLENREMPLADGRFLVHPHRFDALLARPGATPESLRSSGLLRVHPAFRVVALGMPSPPHQGFPLDPPLRSRFQARDASAAAVPLADRFADLLACFEGVAGETARRIAEQLLVFSSGVASLATQGGSLQFPRFPLVSHDALLRVASRLASSHRGAPVSREALLSALHDFYPWTLMWTQLSPQEHHTLLQPLLGVSESSFLHSKNDLSSSSSSSLSSSLTSSTLTSSSSELSSSTPLLSESDVARYDWCLVGDKGVGKSHLSRDWARIYPAAQGATLFSLYRDMSARDLYQRRSTDAAGDTVWEDSPVVRAAIAGHVLVLDGLHRLTPAAISALRPLLHDREVALPDGTLLLSASRMPRGPAHPGARAVSPNFRVLALAEPPSAEHAWMSPDVLSLFAFKHLPQLPAGVLERHLRSEFPGIPHGAMAALLKLHALFPAWQGAGEGAPHGQQTALTLRHILRIARRVQMDSSDLYATVARVLMRAHMPAALQEAFDSFLQHQCNIIPSLDSTVITSSHFNISNALSNSSSSSYHSMNELEMLRTHLQLDDLASTPCAHPELVPQVTHFVPIDSQIRLLRDMLTDWKAGEKHLLLIGPQGTGKNKLTDALLQLAQLPREYIQLHRDTTVNALVSSCSVEAGRIVWEDSPLIRALRFGRVLVIDEADKAPLEVVCIVKALVEDQHFFLPDGRRIGLDIPVHPDFRTIVLANRAGYPFLGNDFLRECGDLFSVHVVENPDPASELNLLARYGPDVPLPLRQRLVDAFRKLRQQVSEGTLAYPYSTRELVNITKHLQSFPQDGVARALSNIFDFDRFDAITLQTLRTTLASEGLSVDVAVRPLNLLAASHAIPDASALSSLRFSTDPSRIPASIDTVPVKTINASYLYSAVRSASVETVQHSQELREQSQVWTLPDDVLSQLSNPDFQLVCSANGAVHVLSRAARAQLLTLEPQHSRLTLLDLGFLDASASRTLRLYSLVGSPSVCLPLPLHGVVHMLDPLDIDETAAILQFPASFHGSPVQPHKPISPQTRSEERVVLPDPLHAGLFVCKTLSSELLHLDPLQRSATHIVGPAARSEWIAATDSHVLLSPAHIFDRQRASFSRILPASDPLPSSEDIVLDLVDHLNLGALVSQTLSLDDASALSVSSPLFPAAAVESQKPTTTRDSSSYHADLPQTQVSATTTACDNRLRAMRVSDGQESFIVQPYGASLIVYSPKAETFRLIDLRQRDSPILGYDFCPLSKKLYVVQKSGQISSLELFSQALRKGLSDWQSEYDVEEDLSLLVLPATPSSPFDASPSDATPQPGDSSSPGMGGAAGSGGFGAGSGGSGAGGSGGGGSGGGGGGGTSRPLSTDGWGGYSEASLAELVAQQVQATKMVDSASATTVSDQDPIAYTKLKQKLQTEIAQLRLVLQSTPPSQRERQWLPLQLDGEFDDSKLVDAISGEKRVFRKRGKAPQPLGAQKSPKQLCLVFDLSNSMARGNQFDARLDRQVDLICAILEAFQGLQQKFSLKMFGHSGAGIVPLSLDIHSLSVPARYELIQSVILHASSAPAGDHSLQALEKATQQVLEAGDADDRLVIVFSDARLGRYSITPEQLAQYLQMDPRVTSYIVFIAEPQISEWFAKAIPNSRALTCLEPKLLAQIFKSILTLHIQSDD